ncbi:Dyp-type peroxidase [Janthinobacterium sp. SUN118]|uniref:Dyp-type peroxidase n=1 Tax=Janthinobacterium sp. SUN118 TaxID=3004100 RepID=UPI0025B067EC|nr:Dyp-type peroxidase [Janthinobacterium sp. SUN118]MDN2712655.1 Dyp-type peroxidase [Janthinobacterium sp. SUN118]
MAIPQSMLSIVARDEVHLQFTLKAGVAMGSLFKALGALWDAGTTGIADPTLNRHHQLTGGTANIVLGFKPELWRAASAACLPDNLHSFADDLVGINGMRAPATQHDLWVWITQSNAATLYDSMRAAVTLLGPYADLASEQVCFPYHNNVTFDGFADGVANPNPFRANGVAIIADGDQGAGGSTVLLQKWRMDVERLRALPVHAAEQVWGRTKAGSHELSPQPEDSHVGRNQFRRNGEEVDIVRRNANYGNATEAGIMFVGFCKDITVTMGMLRQMYGVGDDGVARTDRLLDFSTALSSAIYFVPAIDALLKMGVSPADPG